jgi:hypothetical protein
MQTYKEFIDKAPFKYTGPDEFPRFRHVNADLASCADLALMKTNAHIWCI